MTPPLFTATIHRHTRDNAMTTMISLDFFPRDERLEVSFHGSVMENDIGCTLTIGSPSDCASVLFHVKDEVAAIAIGQRIIDAANKHYQERRDSAARVDAEIAAATPADVMPAVGADVEALLASDLPGLVDKLNERHF